MTMAEPEPRASDPVPDPQADAPVVLPEPERPEMAPEAASSVADTPASRSGGAGFLGLLLGGVVAAGLGFGLAAYGAREGWPFLQPAAPQAEAIATELAALKAEAAKSAALSDRLAALETREAAPIDLAPLEARIAALEAAPPSGGDAAGLAALQAQVAGLSAKLAAERDSAAQIAAEIDTQVKERIGAAEAEANTLRQDATRQAALLGLQTAFRSGIALPEAIAAASAAGIDLPPPLAALADTPVSLGGLRAAFPEGARAALAAARHADMGDTFTERALTFLQSQTNARALTPQDGADPDAVLSRMEGALAEGDVVAARALAADLPEQGRAALAGWLSEADAWLAADAALAALLAEQ